jgi:MinD superfamily P-loop ATPase
MQAPESNKPSAEKADRVHELVVISGKGGTGKTSIVGAFAALAGGAVLADCDVDAADLHLLLQPEVLQREEFRAGHRASIRPAACTQCGLCEDYCRFDAVRRDGGGDYEIDPLACEGCGVCAHFCPEKAIDFTETVSGEWFVSRTRYGTLVHARLGVAAENSGKLVTLVRTEARRRAEAAGARLLITDGPPGTGCPVIASITGADQVLVVTEPTLSGEHDLQRVLALARHFDVPASVCINKADVNEEVAARIAAACEAQEVSVAGRVRYDPGVTAAQVAGRSLIETSETLAAAEVRALWETLARRWHA